MRISALIWLEHIVRKLEQKHHVTQDEVEKFCEIADTSDLLRKAIARGRISMQPWDSPMRVVI